MPIYYGSFALAILSSVLYHLFQRVIAPGVNPVISLVVTYLTAIMLTIPLFLIFPLKTAVSSALRQLNWASLALAVAIVGLELGFLLAYRAGWNISLAGVATNAAAALILLPAGITLFKERPALINVLGVCLCIVGLLLINARR
jgi:uncharacterized membrane protein